MLMDTAPTGNEWKFKPTFEIRARYERRNDRDFRSASDNRTEGHLRTRVGFVSERKDGLKITVTYQHGYTDFETVGTDGVVHNSDVPIANLEFKARDWTFTAGRQLYRLGDGRLLATPFTWSNLGRSFEGLRARNEEWEAIAFREGTNSNYNPEVGIYALSYRSDLGQTSAIVKRDGKTARRTDIQTLNHIAKRNVGKLDVTLEGSLQGGKNNGKEHRAWALSVNAGYKPTKNLRAFVELNAASGGQRDDRSFTFDPMYPGYPYTHGMRSQVGFRNLNEILVGVQWKPDERWKIDGWASFLSLRDPSDAWYSFSGSANRRGGERFQDPTGRSGSRIGNYVQVEATYFLDERSSLWAGFGVFNPGSFVDRQLGGRSRSQTWGFLAYTFKY